MLEKSFLEVILDGIKMEKEKINKILE